MLNKSLLSMLLFSGSFQDAESKRHMEAPKWSGYRLHKDAVDAIDAVDTVTTDAKGARAPDTETLATLQRLGLVNLDNIMSAIIDAKNTVFAAESGITGYSAISNLDTVKTQIISIDADIRQLFTSKGHWVPDSDKLIVTSAEHQGTSYMVTMSITSNRGMLKFRDVVIKYNVDLNGNVERSSLNAVSLGPVPRLRSLRVFAVSNLDAVQTQITSIDADIRQLLISKDVPITNNDILSITSAEKESFDVDGAQGIKYMVTMDIKSSTRTIRDIVVEYNVDLDSNIQRSSIYIASLGPIPRLGQFGYSAVSDLDTVKAQITSIEEVIRHQLALKDVPIKWEDRLSVTSAEQELFDVDGAQGINYMVTMDIKSSDSDRTDIRDIVVQYAVDLNSNIQRGSVYIVSLGPIPRLSFGSVAVSESNLDAVKTQITNIDADIRDELISKDVPITDSDILSVTSAEQELFDVDGAQDMKYTVTMDIKSSTRTIRDIVVEYHVDLNSNIIRSTIFIVSLGPIPRLSQFGYSAVSDLDTVKAQITNIEEVIRHRLALKDVPIKWEDRLSVTSAEQQLFDVDGAQDMKYMVTMDIKSSDSDRKDIRDIVVEYHVDSDSNIIPSTVYIVSLGPIPQ